MMSCKLSAAHSMCDSHLCVQLKLLREYVKELEEGLQTVGKEQHALAESDGESLQKITKRMETFCSNKARQLGALKVRAVMP